MIGISENYRQLHGDEIRTVAAELESAWQDPSIAAQQWAIVQNEIRQLRCRINFPHFEALRRILKRIEPQWEGFMPSLLDVGAASGFYSEILSVLGFACDYYGVDYSQSCIDLAQIAYPDVTVRLHSATSLNFEDESFDIVLSGCVIIHTYKYAEVISESARVSSKYVIMNRTPLVLNGPTQYFVKEAYGVRCLEIHFEETELLNLFEALGLEFIAKEEIFTDAANNYGQATYLLEKK